MQWICIGEDPENIIINLEHVTNIYCEDNRRCNKPFAIIFDTTNGMNEFRFKEKEKRDSYFTLLITRLITRENMI